MKDPKKIALRLARSILRFQNNDYRLNLPDATVQLAMRVVKESKRGNA